VYQSHGYGGPDQEPVVISGAREVTGWVEDPDRAGVWRADVGDLETRQLFVDGKRAERAALGAGLPGTVTTTDTGYTTDSVEPQEWERPDDIEFVYTWAVYADARCGVADITGGANGSVITMDPECWALARTEYEEPLPGFEPETIGGPTGIENSISLLDKPGSWYLDRSAPGEHVLFYLPRKGESPNEVQVDAPHLETLIAGERLHDVTFQGFTFAHTTWSQPSEPEGFISSWSSYREPGQDGWTAVPGSVAFHGSDRIVLRGNRFVQLAAHGLEVSRSSSDNLIEGNEFTDIADGGIVMGVLVPESEGVNSGNRISDNWIHQVGVENRAAAGIWIMGTDTTTVEHNEISTVPYMGILSGRDPEAAHETHGERIVGNLVVDAMQETGDGGGIYLRGSQGDSYDDGAVLEGNVVTGSPQDAEAFFNIGLYTDDSSEWITVRDNVSYDNMASIGGCDESPDRPVSHLRFEGNFWDDPDQEGIPRVGIPGTWPCGAPHEVTFEDNTALAPEHAEQECRADTRCAAIVEAAGLTAEHCPAAARESEPAPASRACNE
jgi:hypothetical protein